MTWIFIGFVAVIALELLIRICKKYEYDEKREPQEVSVAMPWYGKVMVGVWFWRWLKGGKNGK